MNVSYAPNRCKNLGYQSIILLKKYNETLPFGSKKSKCCLFSCNIFQIVKFCSGNGCIISVTKMANIPVKLSSTLSC